MSEAADVLVPETAGNGPGLDRLTLEHRVDRLEAELAEAKAQIQLLRALLEIDPLTGLYNRRGLERAFHQIAARCKRHDTPATLVMIDLDDFKQVNDMHGHAEGDHLLKRIAEFLLKHIRTTDAAARLSGDEFCLLLDGMPADAAARKMLDLRQKLRLAIGAPPPAGRSVSFSCGVAAIGGATDFAVTLAEADAAMYRDKAGKAARTPAS
ncbi:MAG: GGDEF domain-containing protein [Rhizobiaceae bacterium]|jgi:diguanylate cyclase (GGDEF)-like protein|nr:GGDEF domain-containing protein [Rhizobiaceae bacterium]